MTDFWSREKVTSPSTVPVLRHLTSLGIPRDVLLSLMIHTPMLVAFHAFNLLLH